MTILKELLDALASVPLNAVLRERLDRAGDEEKALHDRIRALEEENAHLKKDVENLTRQVQEQSAASEYIECRGAIFKRKPGGLYEGVVYCPGCRKPAACLPTQMVACGGCGWVWKLKSNAIHGCISELERLEKDKHST